MTVKQKFSQITPEGCNNVMSSIIGLDNDITIGELVFFLEKRKSDGLKNRKEEQQRMINQLSGKCFKIVYSPDHTVLLRIDSISPISEYGEEDCIVIGESITNYKGQLNIDSLSINSGKKWSNYYSDDKEYFPHKSFEEIKKSFYLATSIF